MKISVILFCGVLCLSVSGVSSVVKRKCGKPFLNWAKQNGVNQYHTVVSEIFYLARYGFPEGAKAHCSDSIGKKIPERNQDFMKTFQFCKNENLTEDIDIFIKANLEALKFFCYNDIQSILDLTVADLDCLHLVHRDIFKYLDTNPFVTFTGYTESFCSGAKEKLNSLKEILSTPECYGEDVEQKLLYTYFKTIHSNTPCGSTE